MEAFAIYCSVLVFVPASSPSSSYSPFIPDSFPSTRTSKLAIVGSEMSNEFQRIKRRGLRATLTASNSSIQLFMTTPLQSKELRFPWLRSVTTDNGINQGRQGLKQNNKGRIQDYGNKHESRNSSHKNELKISQKSSNNLKFSRRNISTNYDREGNISISTDVFQATSAYIEGSTNVILPEDIKMIMSTKNAKTAKNPTIVLTVAILSLNRIEFSWKSHPRQLGKSTDDERKKYFLLGPKSILSKTKHLIISEEIGKSNRNQVKPTEDCTLFLNQSCLVWLKGTGPYKFGVFAIIDGDVYGDDDQDYEDGDEMIIIESNQLIKVEELLVSPQKREPPSLIGCHWSDHYRGDVMDISGTTKLVFSARDSLVVTCQVVGAPRPNVLWCRQKPKKSTPNEGIYNAEEEVNDPQQQHHRKESTTITTTATTTCLSWNFTKTEYIYSTINLSTTSSPPTSSSPLSSSSTSSSSMPPSVRLTVNDNHIVLSIKDIVQSEHEGVWNLKISNQWGNLELEPFEIDIAELPPFHHKDDWGLQVENGQSARLLCRYVGMLSNRLVYVWRRSSGQNDPNPIPVEHSERIILSHDGSLIFVHTTPDDDGYYMCGVKSAHVDSGTQFGSLCKLTITGLNYEGHPSSPKLVHHSPLTELVFSGQSITLQCVFSGKPIPKIHWFGPNEQVIKTTTKSGENSLKLINVTLNHEGSYKCRAENEDGRSDGVEFKVMVRELPRFIVKPLSLNATFGQNVSFSTLITGQPFPRIRWFKNGQQINQSRETNSGMEMTSQVTMWNVTLKDVSTLSCHLIHSEGQVVAWAQLNVFEPLRMTKSPEDLHLSHTMSSKGNQESMGRFHCDVTSDQSLPVQLRWMRGIKLAQREVPHLEGRTYVTDGGTLTLNLTSFLGKLRKFYSKGGLTDVDHFNQSPDKPRTVLSDDEASDEDDESYYPYYDDDDIRVAASVFYTCKMNDSLHFVEASARLRLLPPPSTKVHISKSPANGRTNIGDFNNIGQNIDDDVMTQEVRGYMEDQSESQSIKSKILMWGKNLLGDTALLGIVGGIICFTILISTTICLVRRRRFRRKSKLTNMREGSFVLRNSDPSPTIEHIEAVGPSNERSKKWVKPSRFGISPDARMCRHLGNMAEAGLYDDLQEMFVPRSRIKLGECVGIGQFGRVFSALMCHERLKIEERVAVKTMKYKPEETEMAELFLREAVLMRGFKHPHVLGVIGVTFDPDGSPMVVLPFMANGDMRTYIMNSKLFITVLELLKMSLQIAYGMIYLSSIRFVHRDLAARNCMVDDRGLVKVADFGLSRELMVRDYYRLCHNKTPVPVRWMALECLEANVFTTMSDVWSYGILLWELLTRGSVPYADLENWEVIGHVQKGLRPSQPAYCPDSVYQMMQSCWNPDPNERPTFQQLAQDIELIIESANALERCVQSTSSGIEKVIQSATCSTLTGASCRSPIYNGSDSSTISSQFNTFGKKRNLSRDELELNLLPE